MAALAVAALAVLTGCGSDLSDSDPGLSPSVATPTTKASRVTPAPDTTHQSGVSQRIRQLTERCTQLTRTTEDAEVIFDENPQMQLNEEAIYEVVVQPRSGPAPTGSGSWTTRDIEVTCKISARLKIEDADVTPADWDERVYEPPASLEWSWEVTPRREGKLGGELELRPIAIVNAGDGARSQPLRTESIDFTVTVRESFWDRLQRLTTQIDAIRLFVVALVGLFAALGLTKWFRRKRRPTTDSDGAGSAPAHDASGGRSAD